MIRKGINYIKSIKGNQPEVYYEGEVVKDVTGHPAFKIPISTVERYYDLHWEEQYKEYLRVYNPDVGEEISISILRPESKKDLAKLRDGIVKIYDFYRGFFGRSLLFKCLDYDIIRRCRRLLWKAFWLKDDGKCS